MGSDLARGAIISNPSAGYQTLQALWLGCLPFDQDRALDTPCLTPAWARIFGFSSGREVVATRLSPSGLLEPHCKGMEVESLPISSSWMSAWLFLAVVSM